MDLERMRKTSHLGFLLVHQSTQTSSPLSVCSFIKLVLSVLAFPRASQSDPIIFLLSNRKNIYSSAMAGGVATPPMIIVFHDKYTTLNPLWHVRHLGKV